VGGTPEFAAALPYVRALIPSSNNELEFEAARALAMLQDDDRRTARIVAGYLTESSDPSTDFHYLVCLARLHSPLAEQAPRLAHTILNLDRKLGGLEQRTKQSWDARLTELVQQLIRREPAIGDAMLRHGQFPQPAHVELALAFTGERRAAAARRFLTVVRANPRFPWTGQLVDLLAELPRDEVFPLFRAHVNNLGVRDAIVMKLASAPAPADRPIFLGSMGSPQPQVARACLEAMLKLPPDPTGTNLVAPLRLLRRSLTQPQDSLLRAQVIALISSSLKQPFKVSEPLGADLDALKSAYDPVFETIGKRYPGLVRLMNADDGEDPVRWSALLRSVPWARGDAARGEQIFVERGCAACHTSEGAIGPDLSGITQRMSRDDVMNAIAFPSRDIAPAYRSTAFRLRDGTAVNGIVAFESADGWIVQTGAGMSVRLDSREVVAEQPSDVSVMPAGLLAGVSAAGVADLYAYLRALQPRSPR